MTLLLFAIFQSVCIGWVYGKRYTVDWGCLVLILPALYTVLVPPHICVLLPSMHTCSTSSVIISSFCQCAILLVFCFPSGADHLYDNIEDMIGYRPLPLIKYCWKYITPVVCSVSNSLMVSNHSSFVGQWFLYLHNRSTIVLHAVYGDRCGVMN